jgi:hypothetical protein
MQLAMVHNQNMNARSLRSSGPGTLRIENVPTTMVVQERADGAQAQQTPVFLS